MPIRQCILPDDSNSNNVLNIFCTDASSKQEDEENIAENINKISKLSNWLCTWKLKHNITHTALSEH